MRRLLGLFLFLTVAGTTHAHGLLIPVEKAVAPLAMTSHKVNIAIEDQFAITRVEQIFRNHTNRPLEATYVFPVPRGADVDSFTMVVNGKDVKGEVMEAAKARQIYQSIVRRTQDPGLLEYIGNDLLQMRVFPVPAMGEQKVALRYKSIAAKEANLVEYVYPLKIDAKSTATLEQFSIDVSIKSQHNVANVYSPTHAINVKRISDKEVTASFDKQQGFLDRDFQMFYGTGKDEVGLTMLTHRPIAAEKGYFTLLISPKLELTKDYQVPRDVVLVLDTSGSMRENGKMEQARKALKYCLRNLSPQDRFAVINFASEVNAWRDQLAPAGEDQVRAGIKWVDDLEATGGTAINDALAKALDFRGKIDVGRMFTVVFFTDGQPTIGETNCDKILKNIMAKKTASTRIFSFGVGDDVNASFLDQLSEQTRAVSTYVRPKEDIEAKTSALYAKISNPVLTNLTLTTTNDVRFSEIYPVQLPDLFKGTQLVLMGRFSGAGPTVVRLTGHVGADVKTFDYEVKFPERTEDGHEFVEQLWARRKVGFLLDQIRANGEKSELVTEVTALAKKYGITTPYTSYLIVPDGVGPVVFRGAGGGGGFRPYAGNGMPPALQKADGKPQSVEFFARGAQANPGDLAKNRGILQDETLSENKAGDKLSSAEATSRKKAQEQKQNFDRALVLLKQKDIDAIQAGKLGVDLAVTNATLRTQSRLEQTASKVVNGRNCLEVGGVWIDEGFNAKTPTLAVKAQSDAYFQLLDKEPKLREVLTLGNHLVWIAPSGTALIIDTTEGKENLREEEIEKLFGAKK